MDEMRFRVVRFVNRGGSTSWRVVGTDRHGKRVRINFATQPEAKARQLQLEADYWERQPEGPTLKATRLTDSQLAIATAAFKRLDSDDDLLFAVDFWLRESHRTAVNGTVGLDAAFADFEKWLRDPHCHLSRRSAQVLRYRVRTFVSTTGNLPLADIGPETVESYLAKRRVAQRTLRVEKLAVSRFFAWCIERPRRWLRFNPCREINVAAPPQIEPEILTVDQCEALLRAAHPRLTAYLALSLFGGMRPSEAERTGPEHVNFADREIRLPSVHVKTRRSRVVPINDTLAAWLAGAEIKPGKKLPLLTEARRNTGITHWPPDALRHTAISHFFRLTGSYGLTAEWAGNSEAVIKAHYQSRVTSEETRRFWGLRP